MKSKILGLLAVGLLGPICAPAATVVFSFTGDSFGVQGTVTGQLTGLADSGTSAASGIQITSAPAGIGFSSFPVDVFGLGWTTLVNSVTITSGTVTGIEVLVAGSPGSVGRALLLNYGTINSLNNIQGQRGVENLGGFAGATYRVIPSAVPEPGSLALLGLGLVGLGVSRRRKAA